MFFQFKPERLWHTYSSMDNSKNTTYYNGIDTSKEKADIDVEMHGEK